LKWLWQLSAREGIIHHPFGKGGGLWGDISIFHWEEEEEEEEEGVAHWGCGDFPLDLGGSL
jgi:hypothetical protein